MVMDTLHVVKQIVSPWESIAGNAALAAGVVAQMWTVTMAMHSVGFPLVAEQAGSRRELLFGTCLDLAPEWLQVGINVLAAA